VPLQVIFVVIFREQRALMVVTYTSNEFSRLGLELVGYTRQRQERTRFKTNQRRFKSNFSCGPRACRAAFLDLQTTNIAAARIDDPNVRFFLIAVHWMAVYRTEEQMAGIFDRDEKTLRQQIRRYVTALAALKAQKIVWDVVAQDPAIVPLTVDTVHFSVDEPRLFPSAGWFDQKSAGSGLSYEVGVAIHANQIAWTCGAFMGSADDRTILKGEERMLDDNGRPSDDPYECLWDKLGNKKAIGDRLYKGVVQAKILIRNRHDSSIVKRFKRYCRARHENVNARIKAFSALSGTFRHKVKKHRTVFHACVVLVQYDAENGHPFWDV